MRYLFLILLCTGIVQAADEPSLDAEKDKAEQHDLYKLGLGAQVGLTISGASTTPATIGSNIVGLKVGALLDSPIMPGFLSLQTEVNFIQKGAQNSTFGTNAYTKLSYIQLPLLAKVKFIIPHARPFFMAGPYISFLLSSNVDASGTPLIQNFSALEVGLALGAGVAFPLSEDLNAMELFFGARYEGTVNNIASAPTDWKSNSFQLTAGIQF
jgi:hypothetical protein